MADQSWRHLPLRMSDATAAKAVERIAEHAEGHRLGGVDIILHGGEPLLAGPDRLASLVRSLHDQVPAHANVSVQTNGTLLSRPMLETLESLGVSIGISLNCDAEATGRNRVHANGRNSFGAVADGLDLLRSPEFRDCYGGVLCTIDTRNAPVATYEVLLKLNPSCRRTAAARQLDLPSSWHRLCGLAHPSLGALVFSTTARNPYPLFQRAHPARPGPARRGRGTGLLPSTLVVVDTDGSIKQLDSLSSAYPGAADTVPDPRRLAVAACPGLCLQVPER